MNIRVLKRNKWHKKVLSILFGMLFTGNAKMGKKKSREQRILTSYKGSRQSHPKSYSNNSVNKYSSSSLDPPLWTAVYWDKISFSLFILLGESWSFHLYLCKGQKLWLTKISAGIHFTKWLSEKFNFDKNHPSWAL